MPKTPVGNDSDDRRSAHHTADSFARFRHVAATQPEKLRHIPALAKELGIGESTAYRYRQRLAQLAADAGIDRPVAMGADAQPPAGAPHPGQAAPPLTPEEVNREIAKILLMARRIRGFRRTNKAVTNAEIAKRLGIAEADIDTTVRFAQVYGELERRLQHQQPQSGAGKRCSRK